jgi:hypothetical protein
MNNKRGMKKIIIYGILLCTSIGTLQACQNETQASAPAVTASNTEDGPQKTGTNTDARFLVTSSSFGLIKLSDDYDKLVMRYNAENVQDGKLQIAQSENELDVTYMFKGTAKEIIVHWLEKHKTIARIEAVQPNNPYKDEHGIGYGTTMQELETINGATISFNGFKWEMAGMITDFHKGKLQYNNESDHVLFNIDIKNDNPPAELMGDVILDTELTLVQDHMASIFVNQIILINN